jgi:2-polyprenyl-3-methyl-5-hydroxy-6-metoxy-1,4-benzoquinol methylase
MSVDFRAELYNKYVSTFKSYIGGDNTANPESDYRAYEKQYLPLINSFNRDASLIDIGCGTGYFLQFLKSKGFNNLYGIDISEEQIDRAKQKGIHADVADAFHFLRTTEKKFDIIFILDFVEHFYKNELFELFQGLYAILNTNGIIIIRTPNGQGLFPGKIIHGDLTHLTIFNPNSLLQLLQATGFKNIKSYETGPVLKDVRGLIRTIIWKIFKVLVGIIRIAETGDREKIITQDFICVAQK